MSLTDIAPPPDPTRTTSTARGLPTLAIVAAAVVIAVVAIAALTHTTSAPSSGDLATVRREYLAASEAHRTKITSVDRGSTQYAVQEILQADETYMAALSRIRFPPSMTNDVRAVISALAAEHSDVIAIESAATVEQIHNANALSQAHMAEESSAEALLRADLGVD
jgi:hypothetical protein